MKHDTTLTKCYQNMVRGLSGKTQSSPRQLDPEEFDLTDMFILEMQTSEHAIQKTARKYDLIQPNVGKMRLKPKYFLLVYRFIRVLVYS